MEKEINKAIKIFQQTILKLEKINPDNIVSLDMEGIIGDLKTYIKELNFEIEETKD